LAAQFFDGITDIPDPVLLFIQWLGSLYGHRCYEYTKHLEDQIPFPPLNMLLFSYEHCVPGVLYILSRWTGIWKEIWDFDDLL